MTLAARPFSAAINHLLAREPWAQAQLAPYAGKTARLAALQFTLDLRVTETGLLEALPEPVAAAPDTAGTSDTAGAATAETAHGGAAAHRFDVTITAATDALPAFAQGGQAAAMKHVRIEGDAEFATTIARLAEHLRWEPEEDLAGLIGDAPAHQLARSTRAAVEQLRRSGRNLLESVVEYLLDEDPQLVRHAALDQMRDEIVTLRDTLARLEKRIGRLDRLSAASGSAATASAGATAHAATSATQPSHSKIDSDDGAAPSDRSR
jgi:ubiquinone biosynthesis protein UbiJ